MRKILTGVALVCLIGGCQREQQTYRPRPDNPANPGSQQPNVKADMVTKVGKVDMSSYGIPIFPGAKVQQDLTFATKAPPERTRTIQVTLEAFGSPSEITEWYSKQIKAQNAYLVGGEGGALDGTTSTGRPVRISIMKIEEKTIIAVTVEDTRKN